jgi:hypothetical protein
MPCRIGAALMFVVDPITAKKKFELANGRADGFLDRESVSREVYDSLGEGGLEKPYYVGGEGCIEPASELDCEGSDYILTDSRVDGCLSSKTKLGTGLSFRNGLFSIAHERERPQFRLAQIMEPLIPGNLRIFVVAN